jgi:hypothetical protein
MIKRMSKKRKNLPYFSLKMQFFSYPGLRRGCENVVMLMQSIAQKETTELAIARKILQHSSPLVCISILSSKKNSIPAGKCDPSAIECFADLEQDDHHEMRRCLRKSFPFHKC